MPSLLRWISLAVAAAVLYGLGTRGFHHRYFATFVAVVLGLAIGLVAVVFATSRGEVEE